MTRINLVDPSTLSNQHLMAEYRELPRIFTAIARDPHGSSALQEGKTTRTKPLAYTLGKGHVIFFYDKVHWLLTRYQVLHHELIERSYNLDEDLYKSIYANALALSLKLPHKIYEPTCEELYLNMARLAKRSKMPQVLDELASL